MTITEILTSCRRTKPQTTIRVTRQNSRKARGGWLVLSLALLFPSPLWAAAGDIRIVAGTGFSGYNGDYQAATTANLHSPNNVALDSSGNLYIADTLNYRIRKVGTNGFIYTVAGTGEYDYRGDGGRATAAALRLPVNIAVDSNDNLYIADFFNYRIRKVTINGIISTVVGSGVNYFSGDGVRRRR